MEQQLKENERIDDLQRNGCVIIQNPKAFCFGMDAVLLSGFASVKKGEQVLDLCSGNGIIAILLAAKTEALHIEGLEIQPEMAEMASRSIALNHMEDRLHMTCGDLKEAASLFKKASFDVITCNPPYMNSGHGLQNPDQPKAVARHELKCSFEDVAAAAAMLLKPGGRFDLVHRPQRLPELFETMKKYHLEPKRMKMVHPFRDAEANMVLLEAVRGGGAYLKTEAPVIVYSEPGKYTDEIYDVYGY